MRTKSSLKSMITSFCSNTLSILIGIVAQALFIKILGSEYLGLNSLFSNIISMLSIVELGIGSAIVYNLYEPIATNNTSKIKTLMNLYKKSYHIIGLIVFLLGILLMPILKYIVDIDSVTANINVYYVYCLFLIDTVFSYFLSYKRSILYANQKNYIINVVHIFYTLILNVAQIYYLYLTKNYYLYLIIKIIMRIIENVVLTYIADKMYSYLKEKNIEKLDKITENDILKKVKSLFMHQIGTFVINGTDNIIISRFLGLVTVGLYSNYYLIINSVNVIFSQFIQSTTASIGNLLVTEDCNKQFSIFKNLRFINLWISIFAGTSIFVIMDSFIQLWIGKEFILPIEVLLILTIVFYFNSTKATYKSFKEAAGIFYEDRYVPLVESLVNIVFSLIFVKLFGLVGVFIGTLISQMVLWLYSYPKYIYINLFKRNYYCYVKETIINFLTFVIIMVITYSISKIFVFDVVFLELIKNVICSIVIPNFILFILFFKCDEFKFLKHNIFHMFRKKA